MDGLLVDFSRKKEQKFYWNKIHILYITYNQTCSLFGF